MIFLSGIGVTPAERLISQTPLMGMLWHVSEELVYLTAILMANPTPPALPNKVRWDN